MLRLAGALLLLLVSAPLAAQGWTMEEAAKREQEALKRAKILRIIGIPGVPASVAATLKELGAEVGENEAKIALPAEALFEPGKEELKPDAAERLKLVAAVLREFPATPLTKPYPLVPAFIECHGDAAELCQKRAAAVKDWLIENAGIDSGRLATRAAAQADGRKPGVEITVRKTP